MDGSVDLKTIITIGGLVCSVAGAAAVGKMQLKAVQETLNDIEARLRGLDKRLDVAETKQETLAQRTSVLSSMMDPSTMERRHREAATVQAEIRALQSSVSKLLSMHNGRHPKVD